MRRHVSKKRTRREGATAGTGIPDGKDFQHILVKNTDREAVLVFVCFFSFKKNGYKFKENGEYI